MTYQTLFLKHIPIENLDLEEMKKTILINLKKNIAECKKDKISSDIIKLNQNLIKNIVKNKMNRKRKLLKLYSEAETSYNQPKVINNELYELTNNGYNNIFKTENEKTFVLKNLEETFEFIMKNEVFSSNWFDNKEFINVNKLKEYWKENPSGIITIN